MRKFILFFLFLLSCSISLGFAATDGTPDAVSTEVGSYVSGDVDSLAVEFDSDYYILNEISGAPAIDLRINFTGVLDEFHTISGRGLYSGGSGHEIDFQLWNYSSSDWNTFASFEDTMQFIQADFPFTDSENYITGGTVQLRIVHPLTENPTHELSVDYFELKFRDQAYRGEFLAAGLVASFILIPLLLMILIFTRRRK